MDKWRIDLRQAVRSLSIRRGASLASALVIGIGVGLLTAVFAIADPYTLRPLPYDQPDQLVVIDVGTEGITAGATLPTLDEWRADGSLFKGIATSGVAASPPILLPDGSLPFHLLNVTPNFFEVLGARVPDVERWSISPQSTSIPVILTAAGRRALPPDFARVGSVLQRDKDVLIVIGHLPDDFVFPDPQSGRKIDALAAYPPTDRPVIAVSGWRSDGRPTAFGSSRFLARVQPGVTPAIIEDRLSRALPSGRRLDVRVQTLWALMTENVRPLGWGAFGAGLLILLVCTGNVANLALVRTTFRRREWAMRRALGASRADVLRLCSLEYAVLAVGALACGLVITALALLAVGHTVPAMFLTLGAPTLSPRAAMFAGISVVGVMVAAFLPSAALSLSNQGISGANGKAGFTRRLFMAGQSALAVVLAIGAGTLSHSYYRLMAQTTGFDHSSGVVTVRYPFGPRGSSELGPQIEATRERLLRVPGVAAVGATNSSVVGAGMSVRTISVGGQTSLVDVSGVTPDFFDAAGMSILQGRQLSLADERWAGVVVNQAFVRLLLPRADSPLGQLVSHGDKQAQVVGVVRDVFDKRLDLLPTPTLYALLDSSSGSAITYVLSPGTAIRNHGTSIRRAIVDANDRALISEMNTIGERLVDSVRSRTFATLVLTTFGVAGLGVSISGLVGMVAFIVARRTREIAVRVALGARPFHVRRLVLRETAGAAAAGAAVGILIGRWTSQYLEHLTYGVVAGSWSTALVAATAALSVMLLSALVPAQRAVELSPAEALRVE
jgi:predicted permease